jgi:hypothetical protein
MVTKNDKPTGLAAEASEDAEKLAAAEAKITELEARLAAEASEDAEKAIKSVSKKQLVEEYGGGASYMELAKKYYGSASDENINKIAEIVGV